MTLTRKGWNSLKPITAPEQMRVWETTVKRVAYFGFVMNDTECQEFLDNNT